MPFTIINLDKVKYKSYVTACICIVVMKESIFKLKWRVWNLDVKINIK